MKNLKQYIVLLLALCLCLGMAACTTGTPDNTSAPATSAPTKATEATVAPTTAPADDSKVHYIVKVVDESGNPISGAMVQICKDTCLPGTTNDSGVAEFVVAKDDYKVSFLTLPSGYTYTTEKQEFYFEDGSLEMTITLKAA